MYLAQSFSGITAVITVWEAERMGDSITNTRKRQHMGGCWSYEEHATRDVMQKCFITGKSGAVIGSAIPWAEAILLAKGTQNSTTIEDFSGACGIWVLRGFIQSPRRYQCRRGSEWNSEARRTLLYYFAICPWFRACVKCRLNVCPWAHGAICDRTQIAWLFWETVTRRGSIYCAATCGMNVPPDLLCEKPHECKSHILC
jgi:hypothetical protein